MLNSVSSAAVADESYEQLIDGLGKSSDVSLNYLGSIDGYADGYINGWAVFSDDPTKKIEVCAFRDNQIVASGIANLAREDLVGLGIGDGACGFQIKLDEALFDGLTHKLKLFCDGNVFELGEIDVHTQFFANAKIESISAGQIRGSISLLSLELAEHTALNEHELQVFADNKICTTGQCVATDKPGEYKFAVPLPNTLFDDRYHSFFIRLADLSISSDIYQAKLNSYQTPWEHLSVSETANELSSVSNQSAYRYKALQEHVRHSDAATIKNAMIAHDVLVGGFETRTNFPVLTLPEVSNPTVSVVIPVHNNFALTYNCIASLILAFNKVSFEVVVVDDCSSDQTTVLNDYVKNVVTHRNEQNAGFQITASTGVDAASGEYVVLLNNDTEVTVGWLDALYRVFNDFNHVGIAGSKLVYPDGTLQEAGGIVWNSGKPGNVGHGLNPEDPKFNYTRQVDYISGAALMIRADVWKEVDGFSEEFAPAYYEDTDLAFKVRQAGYRVFYGASSVVIHHEGKSHGTDVGSGIKQFQNVNAPKFRSKWRHEYRHNGAHGKDLNLQKDRNIDFRVLMVDCTTPRPDQDAGSYAFTQEMRLLQELGCKITFAPHNMAYMGKYTRELQDSGVECVYTPFYKNIGYMLKERGSEFDLVYITRFDVADDILACVKQFTRAKVVLNNCDLHFLREMRAALLAENRDLTDVFDTRERELDVMENVDAVLSYSEIEHTVIASHSVDQSKIYKCPWVLKPNYSKTAFNDRKGIAFLGGFNHLPNREAVEYFVNSVMPLLREQLDGAEFHIYGSKVTPEIQALASDDVIVKGYVESLSTLFDQSKMLVAPLISGAGIKGKVLDSLANGVPSILSPIAVEATGLAHGYNTLVADTPEQWVKCIVDLYTDQSLWENLVSNSHALVETEYSKANGLEKMTELLRYLELDPADNRRSLLAE